MNLYFVLSETLYDTVPIMDDGSGPEEPYKIAELVLAETSSQAKWIALKENKETKWGIHDLPKCSVKKLSSNHYTKPRIVSHELAWEQYWSKTQWK